MGQFKFVEGGGGEVISLPAFSILNTNTCGPARNSGEKSKFSRHTRPAMGQ